MARYKITSDHILVELGEGSGQDARRVAALKQGYDGGWSISSDPEPLAAGLPGGTFPTQDDLAEAIRQEGHELEVEAPSHKGAGH